MYAAVYSVNGLNHYPNEIEYKDAMYYIYIPKRLSEKEYDKLVSDLLKFAPGELI